MTGLSRSFIQARPAAPQSTVALAPPKTLRPRLWRPTRHPGSRWYLLELPAFGHRRLRVQRDRLQFPLAMIPCPQIGSFSRSMAAESKPVRECSIRSPIRLQASCFGCIRDDSTEPGIVAGTQRLLEALFPAPHPSGHPREYVRPHGPWITASGSSWWWEAAGEIPPPVFRCSL